MKRVVLVDNEPVNVRTWRLLPPSVDAITFPGVIFIRPGHVDNVDLLEHEYEHIRQWRRHGIRRFLRSYMSDYLRGRRNRRSHKDAYLGIDFEREAREASRNARIARQSSAPATDD